MFLILAACFYYFFIVRLSAQDHEESTSLSMEIAERIAKFFCSFGKEKSIGDVFSLANYFEHPIRKIAHFAEYGIFGSLLAGTYLPVMKIIRRDTGGSGGMYRQNIMVVFIFAALDEFHQYFVPGRFASVWDILLDTAGCAFFLIFVYHIFDRKKT